MDRSLSQLRFWFLDSDPARPQRLLELSALRARRRTRLCLHERSRTVHPVIKRSAYRGVCRYQMEPDWSVREHEQQAVSFLTDDKRNQHVTVVRSWWFRLGTLRTRRFEARYLKNNKPVITDHIVALHQGVEYELVLVTSPGRYAADRRQFERIIATWRLTPRV